MHIRFAKVQQKNDMRKICALFFAILFGFIKTSVENNQWRKTKETDLIPHSTLLFTRSRARAYAHT